MVLRLILLAILILVIVMLLMGRSSLMSFRQGQRLAAGKKAASKLMRSARDPETFIASIPKHAQEHVRRMEKIFGAKLGFQKADLATIDRLITKTWDDQVPKEMDGLVLSFGAYFGETVRRLRGGRWEYDAQRGFCLRDVGGVASVYPFEKVRKRFEHGSRDSLSVFYTALGRTIDQRSA